jgi:riboflavin kinase/FMN adenylyltransferase
MRIIRDVRTHDEQLDRVVLTIGSFDGVHLGHRRLLDTLLAKAREIGGIPAVMTLRPHPREFFSPKHAPNILTAPALKERLLEEAGVELLFVLPFNAEVASMDRQAFLEDVVLDRCHARHLIVGHDFAFGRGAAGNYEYLQSVAAVHDLDVAQVPALYLRGERVSSTIIRERVLQGDLEEAEQFLGRKYAILGEVVRGRGMGKQLGFPTANIPPHNLALPAHGVYVAEACVDGVWMPAAVNIGIAPTIRHDSAMVEAYLLDYEGDLVGKTVEIRFHRRLRPEKKYDSLDALIAAIAADVAEVRAFFGQP